MMGIALLLLLCVQLVPVYNQGAEVCAHECDVKSLKMCTVDKCRTLIKTNDRAWGCDQKGRLSVISATSRGRLALDYIACDCDKMANGTTHGSWYGSIEHETFYIPPNTEVQCVPMPRFTGEVDMKWYTVDIVITSMAGVVILFSILSCMGCLVYFRSGFQSL